MMRDALRRFFARMTEAEEERTPAAFVRLAFVASLLFGLLILFIEQCL